MSADEYEAIITAVFEGRACRLARHQPDCCRTLHWEDAEAVIEGRACFVWRHSPRCLYGYFSDSLPRLNLNFRSRDA